MLTQPIFSMQTFLEENTQGIRLTLTLTRKPMQKTLFIILTSRQLMIVPDYDNIHPLIVKHCGEQFKTILFKLFNACLKTSKWPWSTEDVIFLQQPEKPNYISASAHLPITMSFLYWQAPREGSRITPNYSHT